MFLRRDSDNYDAMALFESTDGGKSWQCRSAAPCQTQNPPPVPHGQPSCIHPHTQCKGMPTFGNVGELYPRFTRLPTTPPKALLTFTVRCGMKVEPSAGMCNSTFDGMGLGLRAVVSHDDGETVDPLLVRGGLRPLTEAVVAQGRLGTSAMTGSALDEGRLRGERRWL